MVEMSFFTASRQKIAAWTEVEEHGVYDIQPRTGAIAPGDFLHVMTWDIRWHDMIGSASNASHGSWEIRWSLHIITTALGPTSCRWSSTCQPNHRLNWSQGFLRLWSWDVISLAGTWWSLSAVVLEGSQCRAQCGPNLFRTKSLHDFVFTPKN